MNNIKDYKTTKISLTARYFFFFLKSLPTVRRIIFRYASFSLERDSLFFPTNKRNKA